jgi:NAD(P)-dependent dehydrogenase (short-subunit alcohol dehydrogenase family)
VDVADADRTAQALLYATRALGVLVPHLVFHNAGWLAAQPLLAQSEGPLAAFRVNAAHTQLHRQLLHRRHAFHAHWPLLDRAQHQSVVVASAAGLSHAVRLADYCAAKAAAIASARSLRLELARASADPAFHAESFAGGPGDAATARLCAKASFRGVRVDRHFAWTQDGAGETARRIVGWTPRPPLGLSVLAPLLPLPPQPVVASGPASCPADCFPAYPVAAATSLRLALPWHIRTPMFHAIAANTLTRLLFPSLCPRAVARALVGPCLRSVGHAQSSGYCSFEADEMVLPPVLKYLLPVLALLPTYISDVLTGFVGGWYGMDTYLGRDSGELKSDRIGASLWDRCIYGKGNISTDSYVTFMVDKEVKSG